MTMAVCLRCGEIKHGAFNPCPKCGYRPDDDESLTKHLLVTDHYHTADTLRDISTRIKSGQPVTFDPESVRAAWITKALVDAETKRAGWACAVVAALVLTAVIGVVILVIVFAARRH